MFICFISLSFLSAESSATSLFSLVLVGERIEAGDPRVIALGGASQMIADSLGVLQQNPALLTFCRKVTIGTAQIFAVDKGRSSDFTEKDVSVSFPVLVAAFPLTKRLTFGIGYRGRYDPDGSFSLAGETDSGDSYKRIYSKSGGFYAIPLTMTLTLSRHVALGLTYSLEKGSVEDKWDITFENLSYAPGAGYKHEKMSGSGYGAGIVLFPGGRLMLGAMYESEVKYDSDITERYTQPALDTSYTETVKLPQRLSVAATWRLTHSWHVLTSYASTNFKDFEGLNFPGDRLFQEFSFAFGAEYTKGLPLAGKRFPIRLSLSYQRLPYDYPSGEHIRKMLFGLGTGLNFADGKAKIDIAFVAGKVGSLNTNTIEDRLVRFYVGVTGSEIWRRKGQGRRY